MSILFKIILYKSKNINIRLTHEKKNKIYFTNSIPTNKLITYKIYRDSNNNYYDPSSFYTHFTTQDD